jgi:F-box-like
MASGHDQKLLRSFISLPQELLLQIRDNLDSKSLRAIRRTCKFFRQFINLETIFTLEHAEMERRFADELRGLNVGDGPESSTRFWQQIQALQTHFRQQGQRNDADRWRTEALERRFQDNARQLEGLHSMQADRERAVEAIDREVWNVRERIRNRQYVQGLQNIAAGANFENVQPIQTGGEMENEDREDMPGRQRLRGIKKHVKECVRRAKLRLGGWLKNWRGKQ